MQLQSQQPSAERIRRVIGHIDDGCAVELMNHAITDSDNTQFVPLRCYRILKWNQLIDGLWLSFCGNHDALATGGDNATSCLFAVQHAHVVWPGMQVRLIALESKTFFVDVTTPILHTRVHSIETHLAAKLKVGNLATLPYQKRVGSDRRFRCRLSNKNPVSHRPKGVGSLPPVQIFAIEQALKFRFLSVYAATVFNSKCKRNHGDE